MQQRLKVGVIGGGAISPSHVNGFRNAGAEVVALCDIDPAKIENAKRAWNIPVLVQDAEEMFAMKELDIIAVAVPNYLHAPYTIKALKAGKHVLCEKPMAIRVADAEEMVATAKACGKLLMAGHNQRMTPEIQKAAEMVQDGVCGEVYHARCGWIRRRGIPGLGGWFTTQELSGGGPLVDIGIHVLDRTWYAMGKPKPVAVSGMTYAKFNDIEGYVCTGMWSGPRRPDGVKNVEDFATALVRFENGATLQFEVSWAANRANEGSYSILMGDKAGLSVDDKGVTLYGQADNMIVTSNIEFDKTEYPDRHRHFIECLTYGDECMVPGEDGLVMTKVLLGIQRSAAENREVRID